VRRLVLLLWIAGCSTDVPSSTSPADAPSHERVDRHAPSSEHEEDAPPVDHELEATVESRLRVDPVVEGARIRVDADRGRVQLFGAVASRAEKQRAIAIAWIDGVTDVDASALTVSPFAARGAHVPVPTAPARSAEPEAGDVVFDPDR
jgi:hyperosmotically inducible periplasmic protein